MGRLVAVGSWATAALLLAVAVGVQLWSLEECGRLRARVSCGPGAVGMRIGGDVAFVAAVGLAIFGWQAGRRAGRKGKGPREPRRP